MLFKERERPGPETRTKTDRVMKLRQPSFLLQQKNQVTPKFYYVLMTGREESPYCMLSYATNGREPSSTVVANWVSL